jgi:predicted DNA-binding WGR domain protein
VTSLRITLEARSSARRCFRAYEIAAGTDLFGTWLVEMSYGRIGTMGRAKVRSFASTAEALAQVNACLRKRETAPRRIGVAYRVRRIYVDARAEAQGHPMQTTLGSLRRALDNNDGTHWCATNTDTTDGRGCKRDDEKRQQRDRGSPVQENECRAERCADQLQMPDVRDRDSPTG